MARWIPVEKATRILLEVQVLQSQKRTPAEACWKLGISEHTYYRWRKEHGRLSLDQPKRRK